MKKKYKPPKIAAWLLKRIANRDETSAILGDAEEEFSDIVKLHGLFRAHLRYWVLVMISLPAFFKNSLSWRCNMFKSHFKTAVNNFRKHKGYVFITVMGLALGMSIFIVIMLYVQHEFGYDTFNKNFDRIYRVMGAGGRQASMAPAIGNEIATHIPDVQKVVRFKFRHDYVFTYRPENNPAGQQSITVRDFGWADSTVFSIFTLPFLIGDPQTALREPFSLVLTESTSERLFGDENPMGKTIILNNAHEYHITGIIHDPAHFHLTFDALASFVTLGRTIGNHELDSFNSWNLRTYILLPEQHNTADVAQKITDHFHERLFALTNQDFPFELFPLKDMYFAQLGFGKQGNIQFVYIFIAVGIFILLIACINYINLSTARASLRAKEVGIKKVVGSTQFHLVTQFLCESVLLSIFALAVSFLCVWVLQPVFRNLISIDLLPVLFRKPLILLLCAGGAVIVGLLSGLYPAFYLSSFAPGAVLKGEVTKSKKSALFRKILTVSQFSISIILIIGTFTVFRQTDYVKNRDLGFDKEHVIVLDVLRDNSIRRNKLDFKNRLLRNPDVIDVTFSHGRPGYIFNFEAFEYNGEQTGFAALTVDPGYIDFYGLQIIEGRNFSKDLKTDELRTCIMNEAAVEGFGLDSPVGTVFHQGNTGGSCFPNSEVEVIGVVKDFNFQSLHSEIIPLVFGWNDPWLSVANIKISSSNIPETIKYVESVWKEFATEFPFEYNFLNDLFDTQYKNEELLGKIIGYFSIIGIVIACLGLFGLSSFMAERRAKEVSIRKVVGANISNILTLLNRDFAKLVIASNIFAWPVAYYAMYKWLQNFAYKTNMSLWIFVLSGFAALAIALITVSYQTLKAARANPVKFLRNE